MQPMRPQLRIHALTPRSTANGPGRRTVVHVQGCSRGCPGCFNPASHDPAGGTPWDVQELADIILAAPPDGVTVSGGEPCEQPEALVALLESLRAGGIDSVVLFSGFRLAEIATQPWGPAVLRLVDVLIDGPFDGRRPAHDGLRGSENQTVHLLSPRHRRDELTAREVEVIVAADGSVTLTGFPDADVEAALRAVSADVAPLTGGARRPGSIP